MRVNATSRLHGAFLLLLAVTAIGGASGAPAPGSDPAPASDKVKIVFLTTPVVKAEVYWQRKRLGIIDGPRRRPLTLERPRDSGPMDVIVRAEGFLPVHTRVYTFSDNKIMVKLTTIEEKQTLFGYRQVAPPDGGAGAGDARPADGGTNQK